MNLEFLRVPSAASFALADAASFASAVTAALKPFLPVVLEQAGLPGLGSALNLRCELLNALLSLIRLIHNNLPCIGV